jgi:hypothetical protein
MGEKRVVLKDDADVSLVRGNAGEVVAADRDAPAVGLHEAGDEAQKRGLAAARGPEQ